METLILLAGEKDTAITASEILKKGGLVAVPTETVYGLSAAADDEAAVQRIYEVKGRPETKPINLLVSDMSQVEALCEDIPEGAYKLAEKYWPGPLTIILKKKSCVPDIVTAGGSTVGVRCPANEETLKIIRLAGKALATPSANYSGEPAPVDAQGVLKYFDGNIECVVDGGRCGGGLASTIVTLAEDKPKVLRHGGIEEQDIFSTLGVEQI